MTVATNTAIHYPTGDGQPVAETFAHLYAILMTIEVLAYIYRGSKPQFWATSTCTTNKATPTSVLLQMYL
jgi:hypothetical protein